MKYGDLRVGKRYVIKSPASQVAVFEGRHSGRLDLADGGAYFGAEAALKFRYTDKDGVERVALFETAGNVIEPEDTKIAREREEVQIKEAKAAATDQAVEFLTGLGLTVLRERREWWDIKDDAAKETTVVLSGEQMTADDIEIDYLTVGKVKRIVGVTV